MFTANSTGDSQDQVQTTAACSLLPGLIHTQEKLKLNSNNNNTKRSTNTCGKSTLKVRMLNLETKQN